MFQTMFFTWLIYLALALAADANGLPPGKGQAIVQQQCGGCHALKVVTAKRASKQQWSTVVDQMITRGADVPDEDIDTLVDYLARNFAPATEPAGTEKGHDRTEPVNVNSASAAELAAALDLSAAQSTSIVSYREQNGNFKQWRDLTKIPGIEIRKIESNKDRLVF
jgi:competence ComEA-like helix-hairpin-helix protein